MKRSAAALGLRSTERERSWLHEGTEVLHLSISYPGVIQVPDRRARRFSRYYRSLARSYERYCERFLFPAAKEDARVKYSAARPFTAWEARLRWQSVWETEGLVSLSVDTQEIRDGQTENRLRRADTWNLYDGYPLRLSDFFPGEFFCRHRILKQLRSMMLARQGEGSVFREDWKKQLIGCFNAENFYVDDKGLYLFYQMYALADESCGTPVFFFPWDEKKGPSLPKEIFPKSLDSRAVENYSKQG